MIRVLIVDDQPTIRRVLTMGLSVDPEIEVIGAVSNVLEARDAIIKLAPDVMTLDVEMPGMDGIEFLRRLMPQHPMPVIMVSSLTREGQKATLDALMAGAIDFVPKPDGSPGSAEAMIESLRSRVKEAAKADVSKLSRIPVTTRQTTVRSDQIARKLHIELIAVGASTGGTVAFERILRELSPNIPGMVVVQHMPAVFTRLYAERLNTETPLEVREAKDADLVTPGLVLIAPGELQMAIVRSAAGYRVKISDGPRVTGHKPSVDHLFNSIASLPIVNRSLGLILTGMGADGARGLRLMRDAGGITLGQDEITSVVYGMPKAAFEMGAVGEQLSLNRMANRISEICGVE